LQAAPSVKGAYVLFPNGAQIVFTEIDATSLDELASTDCAE